jgi:hypothetical protein
MEERVLSQPAGVAWRGAGAAQGIGAVEEALLRDWGWGR